MGKKTDKEWIPLSVGESSGLTMDVSLVYVRTDELRKILEKIKKVM